MPKQRRNSEVDAELEVIRRAITADTSQSIKQTVLSCVLLRSVRRRKITYSMIGVAVVATIRYGHPLLLLIASFVH